MLFPLNQNIQGDDTQLTEHVRESRKSAMLIEWKILQN